jgi:hypothetical protein
MVKPSEIVAGTTKNTYFDKDVYESGRKSVANV